MNIVDYFAKNVKFLRLQKGLKQAEIAMQLGFTQAAWSEYELGTSKPRFADMVRITEFFCISASELIDMPLSKVNLSDREDLQKIIKKVNPNVNLMVNPKSLKDEKRHKPDDPDKSVIDQIEKMQEELARIRQNLKK